jgi:pSer/pThr/pTyr-binding forkhead associated (FHA) protein
MSGGSKSERRPIPMVPWTEETRRGSFEAFFAVYGALERAHFLERWKAPVLMTAVSTDSATWTGTLVLKVDKRPTTAKIAITTDEAGSDLESGGARIYVGRTPENDVVISAPTVSKQHAYFTLRDIGWEITDNGSSNGTTLEGQNLRANRRERIRRSLATIEFGPDARFVFMTPDSVYDLLEEIHRHRGDKAHAALKPVVTHSPAIDDDDEDFEVLARAPVDEDPNASIVARSVTAAPKEPPPKEEKPRHKATWQGKRPTDLLGDPESFCRSTDKVMVPVGKTPEEQDRINFDYAIRAVASLGGLISKLDAVLKLTEHPVVLLGEGSKNSVEEAQAALVKMQPLLRSIRMELTVGDRKPVEIYKAQV